jgi:C4-dicarboxylate-specific signal transduction histidine kinase
VVTRRDASPGSARRPGRGSVLAYRNWSLRRKVSFLLILTSVLPPLVVTAMLLYRERELQRGARVAVLEARADEVLHTIEAMHRGYVAAARRAARDADLVAACAATSGARGGALRAAQARLEVRGDETGIRGMGVVDRTGRVIAATERALIGASVAHRRYFQRAVAGAEAIPDFYVSVPATGRVPTIAYAAPVRSDDGEIIGVCVVWIRASAVWDVLSDANGTGGAGSFSILFDGDGVRIGHSADERLLFHPAAPLPADALKEMLRERRFQERTAELLGAVVPFPLAEVRAIEGTTFRHFSPADSAWSVGVARHSNALGWTLVTLVPERVLEVRAASTLSHVLPATVVALAIALVGGALIMRRVIRPVRALATAAGALGRGDFRPQSDLRELRLRGDDEIGGLARAFRSMARALALRELALRARHRDLRLVLDHVGQGFLAAGADGGISPERSAILCDWFGPPTDGERVWDYLAGGDVAIAQRIREHWGSLYDETLPRADRIAALPARLTAGGRTFDVDYRPTGSAGDGERVIVVVSDVTSAVARETAERQLEVELRQAQKLEAVGRLASGIAHEINTPIQFIGDNTAFFEEAFTAARDVLRLQREIIDASSAPPEARRRLEEGESAADLAYILEEVPKSIARTLEGVRRVATIVRAMKEFARPDHKEMVGSDLNAALLATLEVARSEYNSFADVRVDLGDIPRVLCDAGDVNQVFLNIIVNAAHAIEDVVKGTSGRGTITVATCQDSEAVIVAISDTGGGIPDAIRDKVFDPFFTTKDVGRGTGQGLAVSRSVVTKHGGQLTFTSTVGRGTTFFVRLLIDGPPPAALGGAAVTVGTVGTGA